MATVKPLWPLAFDSWGDEEVEAACSVIRAHDLPIKALGANIKAFEAAFAGHVGALHAVMVNSGSSANLLAVAALHELGLIRPGDEAIVPAIAWATTYAPLAQHGLRLVVVDVDPETLNAPAAAYEREIGPRTKLLVGVSILGNPAEVNLIKRAAEENECWFLEDNCESLGAKIGARYCGTFGDVGTFSFFFSHHLSTGEGGMLVTDDAQLADMARCLRAHGWTRDIENWHDDGSTFDRPYVFVRPGYNLRSSELAGAVGLVQLRKLEERNVERSLNTQRFRARFSFDPRFRLQRDAPVGRSVPFGFPMIFRDTLQRNAAARAIQDAGIECRLITGGSFARHPVAARYQWRYAKGGTPNADRAHDCGLFVGNAHFPLGEARFDALAAAIDKGVP